MTEYKVELLDTGLYVIKGYLENKVVWTLLGPENIGYISEEDALNDLKNYL